MDFAAAVTVRPCRAEDCADVGRMIRELAAFEKMSEQVKITEEEKGVGQKLLSEIAKIALEKGCTQMRLGVLDWNRSALDFYSRRGAVDLTASEGWHSFRFEAEALQQLALGEAGRGAGL
ncbi:hypothetical protein Chor_013565, partial [Crotalus horridus]